VPTRSGSLRTLAVAVTSGARPSALTAEVFDLDELELVEVEDDDLETIDEAWLEPVEETVAELLPEDTAARHVPPSRYPPGVGDDEVHAIVGHLTAELCT